MSIPPEPTSSSRKTDVVADSKVSNNKKTGGDKKVVSDKKVSEFKKGKEPKETVPANNDEVSQSKSEIPHKVESKPESMTSSAVPSSSPPLKELTLGLGGGPTGNGLEAGVQFMIPESLAVGAKVDALFDDNIHFYSAVVNAVEANGQVHLRFDDGDEREHVPLSEVRIKDPNNATMHIDVDTEEETNSIDKLQAMLGDLVPSKDTIINPTPPPTTEPMVVQKKLEKEKSIPHSPKDPRLNRFSSSRGSGTPPRRASPLRGLLEKDSSRAAGQAKKQLSQLEQMREEVARIRLMNERDMPAITEPSHEEEAPSPVSSPTQIPSTTLQLASTRLELVVEEQKDDNKKGSNMPETPVVSQKLRAWQDRHGNEPAAPRPGSLSGSLSSSLSVAPRSSSAGNTATTTGTARTLFVGGGDRGSNSTGRVLGGNSGNGDSNIRTITRSSIQATSAPSRISAITPPPRSNSRGPSESSDKDEGGKAKLRNMSPLIAQRMAAFHKSR